MTTDYIDEKGARRRNVKRERIEEIDRNNKPSSTKPKGKKGKKKRHKKHRKFWLVVKIIILIILLTILGAGVFLYFKYGDMVFAAEDNAKQVMADVTADTFRANETSIAYDNKGKQLAILKGEKDSYYLPIDKIPKYVKDAFIVTEDKKFYEHNGIDLMGIVRAGFAMMKNSGSPTQGASTITQQLVRGTFLNTEKTVERKVKEIFLAMELEKKFSKDQILEFYLNSIYFMNGYYGIEAAAKGYFSKSCQDLTLGELTFLCAIPNNPSLYNPLKRYKNTISRKNRILDQMLKDGVINRVEYDQAHDQKITLKVQEVKKRDYIETFISYCAIKKLMEKNGFEFRYSFADEEDEQQYNEMYEEERSAAEQMLKNNGYRIYTSIDLSKTKQLQKAVDDNLKSFKEKTKKGIYKMQGSATCIDNETGRVVAIVGGRSQKNEGYTLNRAFQAFRQPGSTIKPLVVYTPSLERGKTRNTMVNDHKFEDGPSNSGGSYYGNVPIQFAVEHSLNTVAWQLFEELTPEVGLQYLKEMEFQKIVKSDYYLPASLGGLTYGASSVEMASAYSTLGNGGKFREPTCIVTIQNSKGDVVVDDNIEEKYIYKHAAADEMLDIMQGVFVRGTAAGHALENMACAGKTGTTSDKKDGWFCGLTPYYTTAVWIGYDSPKTVPDLYGNTYPLRTWEQFMSEIHKDLPMREFEISAAVKKAKEESVPSEKPKATKVPNVDKDPADDEETDDDGGDEEPAEPTEEPDVDDDPSDGGGGDVDTDPNDE
ncbi:MAG: PBP1A family penicillin-binding protein [Eubacterium sp.]|nr:PBP1A family penicillin-binding protein [Eubacterium sp.]